ncbi:hypothetical protein ACIBCA_01640 [Kitasatospora sp. NPDC051170]|uniref:hypothetical protein n=1 Tax=Kitasatospora sp. NPDC051170 TaxID=3364056 RepID=UPI00378A2C31
MYRPLEVKYPPASLSGSLLKVHRSVQLKENGATERKEGALDRIKKRLENLWEVLQRVATGMLPVAQSLYYLGRLVEKVISYL